MRCSSWSLSPIPRRPTTLVCPRRGVATAFRHCGSLYTSSNVSIASRTTAVCTSLELLLLFIPCSARFSVLFKTDAIFDLRIRRSDSSHCAPKSNNLGHRILKSDLFERSEFLIATCKKKKTDRLSVCLSGCSDNLLVLVWKNCLGFSVGYQRAPGWC